MALAIKENCIYISRRNKLVIHWHDLMKKRRQYRDPPDYAKLTPSQINLYWKLREGNFVPLGAVRMILGVETGEQAWEILKAKQIPIYKFPPRDMMKVLSTDLILLVDSCRLDLDKDNGLWKSYITTRLQKNDYLAGRMTAKQKSKKSVKKQASLVKPLTTKPADTRYVRDESETRRLAQTFSQALGAETGSPSDAAIGTPFGAEE